MLQKKCIPEKASWLLDGLPAVQWLKSKDICGEWIENLIRFITPNENAECPLDVLVNDTYQELSIKNNTKKQRGEDHSHRKIWRAYASWYETEKIFEKC